MPSQAVYRPPDWDREADEDYLMWCVKELRDSPPGRWADSRAEQISWLSQYLNGTVPYQWPAR